MINLDWQNIKVEAGSPIKHLRIQQAGIIEPIQIVEWAAPIVSVVKSDGTVQICIEITRSQSTKQQN